MNVHRKMAQTDATLEELIYGGLGGEVGRTFWVLRKLSKVDIDPGRFFRTDMVDNFDPPMLKESLTEHRWPFMFCSVSMVQRYRIFVACVGCIEQHQMLRLCLRP